LALLGQAEGEGHTEDSAAEDGPGLGLRHKVLIPNLYS